MTERWLPFFMWKAKRKHHTTSMNFYIYLLCVYMLFGYSKSITAREKQQIAKKATTTRRNK